MTSRRSTRSGQRCGVGPHTCASLGFCSEEKIEDDDVFDHLSEEGTGQRRARWGRQPMAVSPDSDVYVENLRSECEIYR